MIQVNAREARERFAELLESARSGETIEITKRGKTVARLTPPVRKKAPPIPDMTEFHASLSAKGTPLSKIVMDERNKARY